MLKVCVVLLFVLLLTACSARTVRVSCDGRLVPINVETSAESLIEAP